MKVVVGIIVIVSLIFGGGFLVASRWAKMPKTGDVALPVSKVTTSVPAIDFGPMESYEDEGGYSLKYPKQLTLTYDFPSDTHLSHVEFNSATYSGKLTILVDAKGKKKLDTSNTVDTTLGGVIGKKLITDDKKVQIIVEKNNKMYTVVEDFDNKNYWPDAARIILDSFVFDDETIQAPAAASDNSSATSDEFEEMIE